MEKVRYKYKESKEGFELKNVKCPTCKSKHINWTKVVQDTSWDGSVVLMAECWSGDIYEDKPRHIFLIELRNLPSVQVQKSKGGKNGRKQSRGKNS